MADPNLWGANTAVAEQLEREAGVPAFRSEKGTNDGLYYCGNGSFEYSYRNAAETDVLSYLAELEAAGFEKYAENAIDKAKFYTYRNSAHVIYVFWYDRVAVAKAVVAPVEFLPTETRTEFEKLADPTLTQIGRHGARQCAPGMSYIMQLSDGRYIVMDGGPTDKWDEENLLRFLNLYKPAQHEKPVIAAWMFSHADGDHIFLATNFFRDHKDDVKLEMYAHGFPDFEKLVMPAIGENGRNGILAGCKALFSSLKESFPDAAEWKFHTGQKMVIADAEIEILYTTEDYFPNVTNWGNDTSSAWRIRIGSKLCTFLGDCDPILCQFMADNYKDELKSDICELSHHGFNGATLDLYLYINPDTCLWACDEMRFRGYAWNDHTKSDKRALGTEMSPVHMHTSYLFNRYLRDESIRARCHYHSEVTTIIPLD